MFTLMSMCKIQTGADLILAKLFFGARRGQIIQVLYLEREKCMVSLR